MSCSRPTTRGLDGHGLTFTIGRGTEVCVAAIEALAPHLVGASVEDLVADLGGLWRRLVTDSQLRWLGPEKGVIHLATAALVNASGTCTRSSRASRFGSCSPTCRRRSSSRASTSATSTTRSRPTRRSRSSAATRRRRRSARQILLREGFPAYTTSAGWLGYPEETLPELAREAVAAGLHAPEAEGRRRPRHRPAPGAPRARRDRPGHRLSLDANQAWGIDQAIEPTRRLSEVDP